MQRHRSTFLIIGILILFSVASFAGTKNLYRLGHRPMVTHGVDSEEALRTFVEHHAEEIKAGFTYGGFSDLYEPFMKQFAVSEIMVESFPAFDPKSETAPVHIEWMMFRSSDGNVKIAKDLDWKVRKEEKVFRFTVVTNCRDYDFMIPAKCANITLVGEKSSRAVCDIKVSPAKVKLGAPFTVDMSDSKCVDTLKARVIASDGTVAATGELTADNPTWEVTLDKSGDYTVEGTPLNPMGEEGNACTATVHVNFPPVCDLKVTPQRGYVGNPFTLDASGSSDPDGEVVKAEFTLKNNAGEILESIPAEEKPFSVEKVFKKSGRFTVTANVTDDMGDSTGNCETAVEVEKRFYALVEGGPMVVRGSYSTYLFARFGFLYMLIPDSLDLIVSAGPGLALVDAPFKTFFMGDVVLNARFNKFFLGGGLGFTTKVKDWEFDEHQDWNGGLNLVLQTGVEVIRNFNARGSLFFEFQMPLHDSLKVKDYHMFLLGFRYIF